MYNVYMSTTNPICLSIIICDEIIRDEKTKKMSLIGLFNTIASKKFPFDHPCLHIYIALTDFEGKANGKIELIKQDDNKTIFKGIGSINSPNRLAVVDLNFEIFNIIFPSAGNYSFKFYINDEYLLQKRFIVKEVK